MPSVGVIKALMHHQYRPNNLEGLYGAHHCTLWIQGTTIARAIGRLGRCQGVLSPRKGSPFSAHISKVLPIARQVYIAFGVYSQPHVPTFG